MSRFFRRRSDAGIITPRSVGTAYRSGTDDRGGRDRSGTAPRRRSGLARLVGASGMLVMTIGLFWLLTDDAFRVSQSGVSIEGARYADAEAILGQLDGIDRAPNVFRIRTSEFVSGLNALPEVESVSAVVTMPANVSVRVQERRPIFTWSDGDRAWLVDDEGVLFAATDRVTEAAVAVDTGESGTGGPAPDVSDADDEPAADPDEFAAGDETVPGSRISDSPPALPLVEDHRLLRKPFQIGSRLPTVDLAVMHQLLAVTPDLLGSRSGRLELSIDQLDGYVLRSDLGWQAVFGHYSPSLQPPETVPRQVQCLSWLVGSREGRLVRVRLAVSETSCGTFTRTGGRG